MRFNMLWIGPALGAVERACLLSVLRQGHGVTLWCYSRPEGVPARVDVADAAEVLSEDRVIRHRQGSPSLFSNWFRYELQRLGRGAWLDTDMYLLRPIPEADYLLGREDDRMVNGAVLRIPTDSPLLPPLLALFREDAVPPWLPWRARIAARWKLLTTGRARLGDMPWGVSGPGALTALLERHGLGHVALPPEAFYPVHWTRADWILDPEARLEDRTRPGTFAVHLWNERIRHLKVSPAPPGSFLARLQAEGA